MMMRPDSLPLLLLLLSLSLLGLAASVCVPRNADPSKYLFSPPSAQSPNPDSSPPPASPSPPSATPSPGGGPSASGSAAITLNSICAYTDYPDVCLSSIQSVAPSLGSATVQEAAGLQIKALTLRAQAAIGYGKNLLAAKGAGSSSCLKDCLDNYDDGADDVDAARNALAARDLGTVNSMLSAAFDYFSCSDVFAEGEDMGNCKGPSPMKDHDDVLTKMTSNTLAICEHLDF